MVLQNKIQKQKLLQSKLSIELYDKSRMDKVVASFFTLTITGLIMGPVFVLSKLENQVMKCNFVILGCVSFFALLCSTCTTAKRHEIFAATAAYCAVLVVFTTSNPNDQNSLTPSKSA